MSLENSAFRMRARHDELKKKEEVRHPLKDESLDLGEHDQTLAEIMQDKEEQDLFINHFIYQMDGAMAKDIVEAQADKTVWTDEQREFLEKARAKFNVVRAQTEHVRESFTPQIITQLARNDKRINQVLGAVGAEQASELLSSQLDRLAVSNPKAFEKTVKDLKSMEKLANSDETKKREEKIRESLQKNGISEDAYYEATKGGLTASTQTQLELLAEKNLHGFKAAVNFLTGHISRKVGKEMYKGLEEQQKFLQDCDKHFKSMGKILAGTLNTDINLQIQKYLMEGGNIKEKDNRNIKTIEDYRDVKNENSPAERLKRYKEYKASEERKLRGRRGGTIDPAEYDRIRDRFADREANRNKEYRGTGLLGALLAWLFPSRADIRREVENI